MKRIPIVVSVNIEQEIDELSALHYFLTMDELRDLGCSKQVGLREFAT